jgi:Flp pilus assembly protein TadB
MIWAGLAIAFLAPLVWLLWLVLVALAMTPPLAFLVAVIAGPGTIWLIVKRVNRRHDPRLAKLPPDPP